jgi:hypothetical protein
MMSEATQLFHIRYKVNGQIHIDSCTGVERAIARALDLKGSQSTFEFISIFKWSAPNTLNEIVVMDAGAFSAFRQTKGKGRLASTCKQGK